MTILMDGNKLAHKINSNTSLQISKIKRKPKLVALQVGDNQESNLYISHKEKKAKEFGVDFTHIKLNKDINTNELINEINILNNNNKIDGIMVQLPLPQKIDVNLISQSISPLKDVDGFHPLNKGLLDINKAELVPPTAQGVIELLKEYNISLKSKIITIIGQGEIAGKPLSKILQNMGSTVILCNKDTKDIKRFSLNSDIIISAVGFKHLIKSEHIKNDSIVINIGFTREDNKVFGDVEFEKIKSKSSYITPITGGTGPMTVAILLRNTLKCYFLNNKN